MTNEQLVQREVARLMRQVDTFVADSDRRFQTHALVAGRDPDEIDAALEMFAPTVEARRREIEAELTTILRAGTVG